MRPSRSLIQRLARAWLSYELDRRVAAELREDDRLRRSARGSVGQVFRAIVQINLSPRTR